MGEVASSSDRGDRPSERRRLSEWIALGVVIAVAGVGLAAVLRAQGDGSKPPVTTMVMHEVPGVTARLVLPEGTVDRGGTVHGKVVVDNATGATLHGVDCNGPFAVELHQDRIGQTLGQPACATAFAIPRGHSTYPVSFGTTYGSCTPNAAEATKNFPKCSASGELPDLPSGKYQAYVRGPAAVSSAPPVDVEVR